MKLSSVHLVNFNSYDNVKFDFKPGLNVIILPNGGGKTTLIEGISFALYGARILESSSKSYIRENSTGNVLVKLTGELQGTEFSLFRYLRPSKVEFSWGETRIKRVEELSKFWKTRLIPGTLFKATICCNQRDAAVIAQSSSAQRRKIVSELLRFDVVTRAINSLSYNSTAVKAVSKDQLDQLRSELADYSAVDESLEPFHHEQYWLLNQEASEDVQTEKRRAALNEQIQKLSTLVDLLNKAQGAVDKSCPVCGSSQFSVEVVQERLSSASEQLLSLKRELASLPLSTALTDSQRAKINRSFDLKQHLAALSLIKRKKELMNSLATLSSLYERFKENQVFSQARKLLRDFLDSTSIPLLNTVSSLTTQLLQGSTFGKFTLTPTFDFEVDGRPFGKYSTGQRDYIAVMFRIAISYITAAVFGIDFFPLLLDSIGDSLDETNFGLMMTTLSSEVVKLFPQVIVTTHHT